MLASERYERVAEMLRDARAVSADSIARALGVSRETVRRDLLVLERRSVLRRVRGGAQLASTPFVGDEAPFAERSTASVAKERIGRAAARLVRPGQTLVIDVGTTALEVARALPPDHEGVVATCSLLVAAELADRPRLDVLVSGGRLRSGDLALSNAQTVEFFGGIHADLAFLGSGGVDAQAGLTDFYLDEASARRTVLRNARAAYILADSAKFGRVARHRVAALDEFTGLISEAEAPRAILEALHGATVIIAPEVADREPRVLRGEAR